MRSGTKRATAAAGTVMLAAAVNVATGMLTQKWDLAWWIAAGVLVVIGGGLQAWLTVTDPSPPERSPAIQRIRGVKVGGSIEQTMTKSGEQDVADARVYKDLSQIQNDSD